MSVSIGSSGSLDLRTGPGIPTSESHQRWQPARAGLINIWRYWDETLTFHQGRLLLLGANGSGKSLGLELLLPFLLDANASPSRLTSAAKARGGLYDRMMAGHTGNTRAGFLWVEFVCGDNYFTVGTRLRASQSTRKVDSDFFTTTQRVGQTLALFNDQREPLTVKLLKEAIGDHGAVHNTAQEHRHAVRRTLFKGFSEDRYDALITALLAMRKEKLSQNLDLRKMSDTLSQALTPLEEHDLATVAEGFERLDRRRAELEALDAEQKVIHRLSTYRKRYAQHVCAQVASVVRRAETERDAVTRHQREATTKRDEALLELQTAQTQYEADETSSRDTEARIEALHASEAYKSGAQLSDLQAIAVQLENNADRATQDHERLQHGVRTLNSEHEQKCKAFEQQQTICTEAQHAVRTQAQVVGADILFDSPTGPDDPEASNPYMEPLQVEKVASLLQAWLRARQENITAVKTAQTQVQLCTTERNRQRSDVEDEELVLERARSAHEEAVKNLASAEQRFADDTNAWANDCTSIGVERILSTLPEEITIHTAQSHMAQLQRDISAEQAVRQSELQRQQCGIQSDITVLEQERTHLNQNNLQTPDAPSWRDVRDTTGDHFTHGQPLWAVLEPQAHLQSHDIDKLEAALTASGFLDAWIANDGQLHLPDNMADILLVKGAPCSRSLADVLQPSVDGGSGLAADTVRTVLQSIALTNTALKQCNEPVAIGLDGSFKLGTALGRGSIQNACYLGATARERRRQARLTEITNELQQLAEQQSSLQAELQQLQRLLLAVEAEFEARPQGQSVSNAVEEVRFQERLVSDSQARVERLRVKLLEAESALRDASRKLTTLAAQYQLPADTKELLLIEDAVLQLGTLCDEWSEQHQALSDAIDKRDNALKLLRDKEQDAQLAAERYSETKEQAIEARARFETLHDAVGQDFEQLLAQSNTLKTLRESLRSSISEGHKKLQKLNNSLGELTSILDQAESDRQRAEKERQQCHERFRQLLVDRITADAQQEVTIEGDGVSAVLTAARSLSQSLPDLKTDNKTIDDLRARQDEALHQARGQLGGQIDLDDHQGNHGWWILVANADGVRMSILELSSLLAQQLEAGRGELAADEEALFERTLAGSIRQSLASRIRQTSQLVDQINTQLESVRTAAGGVAVKLRWHVDEQQADAVQKARQLLLKDPASLSDNERISLQDFVRARVEQARLDLEANAPWQDRLRESLDYRVWHRFSLQVAHRDWDGYKQATEKLMSSLSTGERSVVLHLPMLASIAAHYTSSTEQSTCPRLILLDELFAGVDKANRAQLFGTFSAWQLDAVFTSDHEWCDYATLDGIAIHVLHPSTGDEPVTTTRFIWDGKTRQSDGQQAIH